MKITHADVVRIVQDEYRFSPDSLISDHAITNAFDSARGLIRRVLTGRSLDQEAMSLLIRRNTPPAYVGATVVVAFMADLLDLASDHEDAAQRVGELKLEIEGKDRLIAELRASIRNKRNAQAPA